MTPRGVHQCGRSVLVMDSFHPYSVLVCLEWCFMHVRPISRGQNCERKTAFRPFFDKVLAFPPPRGVRRKCYPLCCLYFTTHIFKKNNFDFIFCCFFVFILVRKPKNVQNLTKMREFKFFSIFKTPQGVDRIPEKNQKMLFLLI